jgi:hypothetical protein
MRIYDERSETMDVLEQASHADLIRVLDYIQHLVMNPEASDADKVEALQLVLAD